MKSQTREHSLSKDRGRITVRLTSSLTSLEMYSKLDKTILNIRAKYISKLVKQEVSRAVILPPTRKRARFFVCTPSGKRSLVVVIGLVVVDYGEVVQGWVG